MSANKIDFSAMDWEKSESGIKSKSSEQNRKKIRLLELHKGLKHPEWCVTGHIGYIIEGELEIEFNGRIVNISKGDALIIAAGEEEKHIPKPISENVVMLLVEDVK